jgi:RHS repeat-associated protein
VLDTDYSYDAAGRLTAAQQGERRFSYEYSSEGFLAAATDPGGRTTGFAHDRTGRITAMQRPDGSRIEFSYDPNGNLVALTNPAGITHRFGYNPVDRNDGYTTPLSGSYRYVYDRDRRLTETILPSGRWITNVYSNGQLRQIQTPEGNIDLTRLCGDKIGTIAKGGESISYEYDGPLVTAEQLTGTLDRIVLYRYNDDFQLSYLLVDGLPHTDLAYDDDGLLTTAGRFDIARDPANGLPLSTGDGRLLIENAFNGYGEVATRRTTVNAAEIGRWDLQRDSSGRIAARTETAGGITARFVYTYDAMGRLLTVTKDGRLVEQYRYDTVGTRIYEMNRLRGIAGRSIAYDAEDRLLTAGSHTYAYNLDGYLTSRSTPQGTTAYRYSSRGELQQVDLPGGRTIAYRHDPLGRRIAKLVDGQIVEKYVWMGRTRLLAVFGPNDQPLIGFEYTDQRMPPAMIHTGNLYYLLYDQVGSLRAVVDTGGNVVKRIDYDSFGNIIADTAPGFKVPLGFAGGLHDRDTGLVRFGFRDYDPDIGRWTAKDPIGFFGGNIDLYGYVVNDPLKFYDPDGLFNLPAMADKYTGPAAMYRAGADLIATGAALAVGGAYITAAGGIPGIIGGGAVMIVGGSMVTIGLWTIYQASTIDISTDMSSKNIPNNYWGPGTACTGDKKNKNPFSQDK